MKGEREPNKTQTATLVNVFPESRSRDAMPKLKSASVNASPLKRRRRMMMMTMPSMAASMSNSSRFPSNAAVVATTMGFKNSGNVRRIVSQYSQVEVKLGSY